MTTDSIQDLVKRLRARTAEAHYPTMEVSAIAALPVGDLAADNAHLYMWVTNPILTEQRTDASPISVVRAWGFEPKTILTWVKPKWGMGFFYRGRTEHVIFAVRGTCPIAPEARLPNLIEGPCGAHSQKPDSFLDMVEQVSPGPYLELFARRARFGWDYWGNESLGTTEVAA